MNKTIQIILLILFSWHLSPAQITEKDKPWLRYTAISPDGQNIAFTYNADIYIVGIQGGKAKRLTSHNAYDSRPVWSHDGTKIAFASDRYGNFDVFVMPSVGGNVKRLTFHSAHDFPTDFSADNQQVLFNSNRLDKASSLLFHRLGELYQVSLDAKRPKQILSFPAWEVKVHTNGDMLFEEIKGGEDEFRKHHTSSVTRDVWVKKASGSYQKLSNFSGEDRNPVFGPDGTFYYLSESSGTINVYQSSFDTPEKVNQITTFDVHPVRYLSSSDLGVLCYSYNGEIYTQQLGQQPQKVLVDVSGDESILPESLALVNSGLREIVPSPNGKEVVFIYRGDVFVTSVDGSLTRRLTHTPEQERSIDISSDGKRIVYAGERNGSWNLYLHTISQEDQKYFVNALELEEQVLLESNVETFQPVFSPNGEEVAYLEERVKLKKINIATKAITPIHDGSQHFSYADGDQDFAWSPDGKWLAITFYPTQYWTGEIGIVSADGKGSTINVSKSGFSDSGPQWSQDGSMLYWSTDRYGMHSVAKTGPSEYDVNAVFLTQKAYDKFKLKKDEFALAYGQEKDEKKKEDAKEGEEKEEKASSLKSKPIEIDFEGLSDRKAKLTLFSTNLSDAKVSKDGKHILYLGRVENKTELWKTDLRTRETKSLGTFGGGRLHLDTKGAHIYLLSGGKISKIEISSGKRESISVQGEMNWDMRAERLYLLDHITRQVKKKFLDPNLHGADWDALSINYRQFIGDLNNDYDFRDILSELLGELNASHTGARYRPSSDKNPETASLGIFIDPTHSGDGLKILEIMKGSPLVQGERKVKEGIIIEAIDGQKIIANMNYYPLLSRKAGKVVTISYLDPSDNQRWKERVKPVSPGQESELRYQRWIKKNRELVHQLSDNQVGYMHIRSMGDGSFREFLEEVMGEEVNKKALIVDTRFNGGGDLVDDLTTFLSGKRYMEFQAPDKIVGFESQRRWTKPSIMLIGEGNYSDAHCTPAAYKDLEIGKLVGMPVPGTCSFVWWERLQNGMVFGIPNLQVTDIKGDVLENKQLEPDILVKNDFDSITSGRDLQIEKAVEEMLKEIE